MIRTNIRINIRITNIRIFEYSNIFVTLWFKVILPEFSLGPIESIFMIIDCFSGPHWKMNSVKIPPKLLSRQPQCQLSLPVLSSFNFSFYL